MWLLEAVKMLQSKRRLCFVIQFLFTFLIIIQIWTLQKLQDSGCYYYYYDSQIFMYAHTHAHTRTHIHMLCTSLSNHMVNFSECSRKRNTNATTTTVLALILYPVHACVPQTKLYPKSGNSELNKYQKASHSQQVLCWMSCRMQDAWV